MMVDRLVRTGRDLQVKSGLRLEFAQFSHPGLVRKRNEDRMGHVAPETDAQARSHGWMFAVADGVGGQSHGDVASRLAIESVVAGFRAAPPHQPLRVLLPQLLQAANTRVGDAGLALGGVMATTAVACALRFDRMVVAHVGDSRCYLIRRGKVRALTCDHTVANEQARVGIVSAEANRSILSRCLGMELFVKVDSSEHLVMAGDVVLLCSDGLHGAVSTNEIAQAVNPARDLAAAAHRLIAIANERDGSDNVTVQLIRVCGVEHVGMFRGRPYRLH